MKDATVHAPGATARAGALWRPASARTALACLAVGLACLAITAALPSAQFTSTDGDGDMQYYERRAGQILDGEWPYGDFFFEYPPLAIPVILAPKLVDASYVVTFRALALLLLALTLAVTLWTQRRLRLALAQLAVTAVLLGCAPVLLGPILFTRYDVWPALLSATALALLVAGRERWSFGALALATTAKVYPAVLAPFLALHTWRRVGRRRTVTAVALFAALGLLIALPFMIVGFGGLGFSFYVQFKRGLQVESLGATVLLAAKQLGLYDPIRVSGLSNDLGGTLADAVALGQTVLLGAALLALLWLAWRLPAREDVTLTLCAAAVVAFVSFSKVLSPQYMVWLLPVVPLVARRPWLPAMALLGTCLVLTNVWFPERYGELVHEQAIVWVALLRNLLLVALLAVLVSWLAGERRRRTPPPAPAGSPPG